MAKSEVRGIRSGDAIADECGLGDVTAGALITGVCRFRDVLRESFVQPTGNAVGIEPMHDEMNNFVPKKIAGEFVGRIALDEETSLRMDSAGPRFQFAERLKLLPFLRPFENVDVCDFVSPAGCSRSSSLATTR